MKIPTEPIGSIPRSKELLEALTRMSDPDKLEVLYDKAVQETIDEFEKTGSPIITDGEQSKPSFVTYPLAGNPDLRGDGMRIDFADGHFRQLPLLTKGPFRYSHHAEEFLQRAQRYTKTPVKQAVISASAVSLIYPPDGIKDYPQEEFLKDLLNECEKDIRQCLRRDAAKVQMDFTEGRLSLKLDPSGSVLRQFIELNNLVFERFTKEEQQSLGVHVCPGGDHDSTHSADIEYTEFLPELFKLHVRNFYLQLASEPDRKKVLRTIKDYLQPDQFVYIGVIDVNNPRIESPEEVRDRIVEAAEFIPYDQLGTTDDCGFSPFGDDVSTTRETAFAKIRARIEGTRMAEEILTGVGATRYARE